MSRRARRHSLPSAAGAAALGLLLAVRWASPADWRETLDQRGFDLVLAAAQQMPPMTSDPRLAPVAVVDIDDRSLKSLGPWPWPRDVLAKLIDRLSQARPAVAAIDILFADPDARSAAALARRLSVLTQRPELAALARDLPDGDSALAQAGAGMPLVLGFVLADEPSETPPGAPFAVRGTPSLDGVWEAAGAVGPVAPLRERANGLGVLLLPANSDGVVRHVPLLVAVGGLIRPGLALEAVRLARAASAYLLEFDSSRLVVGDLKIPLSGDGLLRLLPVSLGGHAARTISAIDVIAGKFDPDRLAGAVVLIGTSAPELAGLRSTPGDPVTPSVQIQADAVAQILAGRFPRRIEHSDIVGILQLCVISAVAIIAAARLAPVAGALVVLGTLLLQWAMAIAGAAVADRLADPLAPSIATIVCFIVTSVASFAVTYRREALLRRRFEQRLAPAVVSRIAENPDLVKLTGERREVTSLFTDIEGLTAMTHRVDPTNLVAVLDAYFEGIAAIVVAHGGMVDKIVGDALHAFFNAPLDLADHPGRAVACGIEINRWTEAYRALPAPAAIGLGRTRIGIETGQVVVGDVGIQSRLDYTAYGDAVNAAARLEAANKELGSAICIGPAAAARCDPAMLRPLGAIKVRGRDDLLAVFEPWPTEASAAWRERYLEAFAAIERDPEAAALLFDRLAAECREDRVVRDMARRLRSPASATI